MKDKGGKLLKRDKVATVAPAVGLKVDSPVADRPQREVTPMYRQAEPVDGYASLYEYFSSSLVYPVDAPSDSIQGVLTVTFTINAEGKPESISIHNSLGKAFEREAIRLIQEMPEWKPAQLNNKPVPSKMSLPLTFQIKEEKL
jgi:TonB family protein